MILTETFFNKLQQLSTEKAIIMFQLRFDRLFAELRNPFHFCLRTQRSNNSGILKNLQQLIYDLIMNHQFFQDLVLYLNELTLLFRFHLETCSFNLNSNLQILTDSGGCFRYLNQWNSFCWKLEFCSSNYLKMGFRFGSCWKQYLIFISQNYVLEITCDYIFQLNH